MVFEGRETADPVRTMSLRRGVPFQVAHPGATSCGWLWTVTGRGQAVDGLPLRGCARPPQAHRLWTTLRVDHTDHSHDDEGGKTNDQINPNQSLLDGEGDT